MTTPEITAIIQKFGNPPEIVEKNVYGYKKETYYNDDKEFVEHFSGITGGHHVQVIIYDGNERSVMVFVDNSAKMMPKREVLDYIKRRISD